MYKMSIDERELLDGIIADLATQIEDAIAVRETKHDCIVVPKNLLHHL